MTPRGPDPKEVLTPETLRAAIDFAAAENQADAELMTTARAHAAAWKADLVLKADGLCLVHGLYSVDEDNPGGDCKVCQQTARVEALEAALAQRGKDGAIGRIYPAHLVEWAKQIRREQHYDSALTSWLERLGTEWAALAPQGPGEEK